MFFKTHLSALLEESDDEIEDEILKWFWDINHIDFDYAMDILNTLIRCDNNSMKVKAISIAGTKYYQKCIDSIKNELYNTTKIERYSGPIWDDYDNVFETLYATKSIDKLAHEALTLIQTKHHKTQE